MIVGLHTLSCFIISYCDNGLLFIILSIDSMSRLLSLSSIQEIGRNTRKMNKMHITACNDILLMVLLQVTPFVIFTLILLASPPDELLLTHEVILFFRFDQINLITIELMFQ